MIRILEKIFSSRTSLAGLGSVTTGFLFMLVTFTQIDLNHGVAALIVVSWMLYLTFQFLQAYYSADEEEKKSGELNETNSLEGNYAEEKDSNICSQEGTPDLQLPERPLTWKEKHGTPYVFVPGAGQAEIERNAMKDFRKVFAENAKVDKVMQNAGIATPDAYTEAMNAYRQ